MPEVVAIALAARAGSLVLDGEDLLARGNAERHAALSQVIAPAHSVPRLVTADRAAAAAFLEEALARGQEGLVAKALGAPYEAGRRGVAQGEEPGGPRFHTRAASPSAPSASSRSAPLWASMGWTGSIGRAGTGPGRGAPPRAPPRRPPTLGTDGPGASGQPHGSRSSIGAGRVHPSLEWSHAHAGLGSPVRAGTDPRALAVT